MISRPTQGWYLDQDQVCVWIRSVCGSDQVRTRLQPRVLWLRWGNRGWAQTRDAVLYRDLGLVLRCSLCVPEPWTGAVWWDDAAIRISSLCVCVCAETHPGRAASVDCVPYLISGA